MWIEPSFYESLLYLLLSPVVFIGCIYIQKPKDADRNDDAEIVRRIRNIGVLCVVWTAALFVAFRVPGKEGPGVLTWLGLQFTIQNYLGVLSTSALTMVFYIGPLFQVLFEEEDTISFDIKAVRAYIFAPIYEELVYRSLCITALVSGGWEFHTSVIVCALSFGLSHLYHLFDTKNTGAVVFQSVFTSVFGIYAGYCFAITGSLYASIVLHSFCNYMGLPNLVFLNPRSKLYKNCLLYTSDAADE